MVFEWDERKRQINLAKHGIDFVRARVIFDGRPVVHLPSSYAYEKRTLTVGKLDGRFVTAVWTRRGEATRLISVRHARDQEIVLYRMKYGSHR